LIESFYENRVTEDKLSERDKEDYFKLILIYLCTEKEVNKPNEIEYLQSLSEHHLAKHFQFMIENNHHIVMLFEYDFMIRGRVFAQNLNMGEVTGKKEYRTRVIKLVTKVRAEDILTGIDRQSKAESEFNLVIVETCLTLVENLCKNPELTNIYPRKMDAEFFKLSAAKGLANSISVYNEGIFSIAVDYDDKIIQFIRSSFALRRKNKHPKLEVLTTNEHKQRNQFDGIIMREIEKFNRRLKYLKKAS